MKKVDRSSNQSKWHERIPVEAYALAYKGLKKGKIAQGLNISGPCFSVWYKEKPLFRWAINKAKQDRKAPESSVEAFRDYVVGHLSPEHRKLWDKINFWAESRSGPSKARALLANHGKDVRQSLWLYAYMGNGFNASYACRMIGIGRDTIDKWASNDPIFQKMVDEIKWHRNNYFETALIDLVAARNPSAVIFANQTQNADRGYGTKVEVKGSMKHSGEVAVNHNFSLEELNLSLECRKEINRAIKQLNERKAIEANQKASRGVETAVDAELIEDEDDHEENQAALRSSEREDEDKHNSHEDSEN